MVKALLTLLFIDIKRGGGLGIPLTSLTLPHSCAFPKLGHIFQRHMSLLVIIDSKYI